jgi:hypothetical protein
MKNRYARLFSLLWVAAAAVSLDPVPAAEAADNKFSLGIAAGLQGGTVNHFSTTPEGEVDPVKAGLIGIHYGYQFGVDLQASFLWAKAMYSAGNFWVTDWAADPTGQTDRRYTNNTLMVPAMIKVASSAKMTAAVGAYYSFALTETDRRDWGMALGFRGGLGSSKLSWDSIITGGFLGQGFGGQTINVQLGLVYSLN